LNLSHPIVLMFVSLQNVGPEASWHLDVTLSSSVMSFIDCALTLSVLRSGFQYKSAYIYIGGMSLLSVRILVLTSILAQGSILTFLKETSSWPFLSKPLAVVIS
jgi:hypothetical protein